MPETVRHGAYRRADGRGGEAMRRRALMLGAVVAPLALPATAQAYPTRPVTLVVPFASGGPTDILARIMADALGERLGTRMVVVNRAGRIVGKYRKIHLPGRAHKETSVGWHNFEKRYFEVGDRAWPVWRTMGVNMGMMICNDRRWPEAYRVMGLQTVELIALGYNSSIANALGGDVHAGQRVRLLDSDSSLRTRVATIADRRITKGATELLVIPGKRNARPNGNLNAHGQHQLGPLCDDNLLAVQALERDDRAVRVNRRPQPCGRVDDAMIHRLVDAVLAGQPERFTWDHVWVAALELVEHHRAGPVLP